MQRVKARRASCLSALVCAAHQQFAVEHGWDVERVDQFGESVADVVATARIDACFAACVHQLHADTVPLPLRCIVIEADHCFFERVGKHEGAEGRHVLDIGRVRTFGRPGEQLAIRRLQSVPVFLHIINRDVEGLRESGLGEAARDTDAHAAGGELDQGIAAIGIEPVEQFGQLRHDAGSGHAR